MDRILSKKNLDMLVALSLKKIYEISGIQMKQNEEVFAKNFNIVLKTILDNENLNEPLQKINGIIIKESVRFILSQITPKEEIFSTKIDDDSEEEIEEIQQTLEPIFEEDIYNFASDAVDIEIPLKLDKIKNIDLLSVNIHNSDYIVKEHNNTFSIDDIFIILKPGNYSEEDLQQEIQKQINEKVNKSLTFNYNKIFDNFSFVCKEDNETSCLIDFGTVNSINKILGFKSKTYKIKSNSDITGEKHHLIQDSQVYVKLSDNERSIQYKIDMDVSYNSVKYFKPYKVKSLINDDNSLFSIDKIELKITDEEGNLYNTRGRRTSFTIRVNQLKN